MSTSLTEIAFLLTAADFLKACEGLPELLEDSAAPLSTVKTALAKASAAYVSHARVFLVLPNRASTLG